MRQPTPVELVSDYHTQLVDLYNYFMQYADKRVEKWLLMDSPRTTILLCMGYLLFVAIVPKLLKDREAFQLRSVMIVYNFAMVLLNFYIFSELLVCAIKSNYNWICTPVDYSNDEYAIRMAAALWWYFFSKPVEFFDTVMFILRKKTQQVTFLHVYHHVSMPLLWWIGIKFVAGGQSFFGALVNSAVHVVMYSYYGLAAMGPAVQKHLWWKKHITHFQLIQFTWAILHCLVSLYIDCPFPKWMQYACASYAFSFLVLFSNFYLKSYSAKRKPTGDSPVENNGKLKSH